MLSFAVLLLSAAIAWLGYAVYRHGRKASAPIQSTLTPTKTELPRGESARQQSTAVWIALYTQSTTLHSGLTKFLATILLAVLGVAATLVTKGILKLGNPVKLLTDYIIFAAPSPELVSSLYTTWGVIFLFFALLLVIGPSELLAYRQRDLADELSEAFNKDPLATTKLPKCRLSKKYFYYHAIPYLLLITGSGCLFYAATTG